MAGPGELAMTVHPIVTAIDALIARAKALPVVPALPEDAVLDGPAPAYFDEPDVIAIGVSLVEVADATGILVSDFGGGQTERFDLACLAQAYTDDREDLATARARAFALFDAVRDAVAAAPDLDGACDRAVVSSWAYRPVLAADGSDGALALIEFTVRVDATRD